MSQLAMELKAQQDIELLRQQLSAAAREILALRAASQAREQQYRGALVIADNAGDDEWHPYTPEQAKTAIGKTIALPQDTSALEAMIQKAGEVMRERCFAACNADKYPNECDKSIAYDCRLAIRTLPGVTLGDLK